MRFRFSQQLAVFAAVFLILQLGLDWLQGIAITAQVFAARFVATLVATGLYGAILWWLQKRKKQGD